MLVFSKNLLCGVKQAFFYIEAVSKMNHFNLQQIAFAAGEEMRGPVSIADRKEHVVCPRPRRVSLLSNTHGRPFRWHTRWFNSFFFPVMSDLILSAVGISLIF